MRSTVPNWAEWRWLPGAHTAGAGTGRNHSGQAVWSICKLGQWFTPSGICRSVAGRMDPTWGNGEAVGRSRIKGQHVWEWVSAETIPSKWRWHCSVCGWQQSPLWHLRLFPQQVEWTHSFEGYRALLNSELWRELWVHSNSLQCCLLLRACWRAKSKRHLKHLLL